MTNTQIENLFQLVLNLSDQLRELQEKVDMALQKDDFIEINDFAQKTGMSMRTIHRHRKENKLKAYRIERKLYVRWSEFLLSLKAE